MRYDYTCQELWGVSDLAPQTTSFDSDGGGDIRFLDRHHVACLAGSALRKFKLATANGQMRYNYTCMAVPVLGACFNRTTSPPQSSGSNTAIYLDRVPVACPASEVLTYFHPWFSGGNMDIECARGLARLHCNPCPAADTSPSPACPVDTRAVSTRSTPPRRRRRFCRRRLSAGESHTCIAANGTLFCQRAHPDSGDGAGVTKWTSVSADTLVIRVVRSSFK